MNDSSDRIIFCEISKNKLGLRCPAHDFLDFLGIVYPPNFGRLGGLDFFNSHACRHLEDVDSRRSPTALRNRKNLSQPWSHEQGGYSIAQEVGDVEAGGRDASPSPEPRYCVTVKMEVLTAVPPGVLTPTGPVIAPEGTVAVTLVSEFTVKLAGIWSPKPTP